MKTKISKFIITLLAAVTLLVSFTSGSFVLAQEDNEDITIGYVIGTLNDVFPTMIYNAAKEKADELGIKIELSDAEDDLIRQQDQVNTFIQNGVDALIVMPVDTSGMDVIAEKAREANIPIIFIDRNPYVNREDEIPEGVFVVGTDNKQAGIMQAEYIGELVEGEGGYAVLMGTLGQESTIRRTEGVTETLAELYPNMVNLATETGEWNRDQAVTITENLITTYADELKVIFANNDEMALGALQATQTNNREDIKIIGIDAIKDALEAIKSDSLAGSIFQDAEGQGTAAVQIAYDLINGSYEGEAITLIDYQLVTPENVSDFE